MFTWIICTETKPEAVYYFGNDTVKLYCKASLGKEAVFQHWLKNNKNVEEGEKYKMHANGSLSILKLGMIFFSFGN